MTTDIFCCTYAKDAEWLKYMLRSCIKFARLFRQVVIVYPSRDKEIMHPICKGFSFVRCVEFEEERDGHMHQCEIKSSCDLYSDADFFLLMDSDCVFTAHTEPWMYMTDHKADVVMVHYDSPSAIWNEGRLPWKEITDRALGQECMWETMQKFPFIYPSWLFTKMRQHIEKLHGISFTEYVHTATPLGRAWHGYSEFCSLGSYAWLFEREHFNFIDLDRDHVRPNSVLQLWSHSGLTTEERAQLEEITAGWERGVEEWSNQ